MVVGGKYGSVGPAGISYTEMEFDLAVELKKPILGFLHGAPDDIPVGRSELDAETRSRLSAFRAKVAERLVKTWKTKEDLKAAVALAIVHATRTKPGVGWIRHTVALNNHELLEQLNALRNKYESLQDENRSLKEKVGSATAMAAFADLEQHVVLKFALNDDPRQVEVTYGEVFYYIGEDLLTPETQSVVRSMISAFLKSLQDLGKEVRVRVDEDSADEVILQLMAIGLIEPHQIMRQVVDETRPFTPPSRDKPHPTLNYVTKPLQCWSLTTLGRQKFLQKRAVQVIKSVAVTTQ